MYKMTLLFRKPTDPDLFEEKWTRMFLPIAEAMPGLARVAVSHIVGEPGGTSDYHRIHEFYFADQQALDLALTSEKGKRAGNILMSFAGEITTILFSEVFEDTLDNSETHGETINK